MLDCERCADVVDGFSMTDAATTDQAVAALRNRLQARVGTPEPIPVATPSYWPRVAAAAALLGVVAGGVWTWEQRDTTPAPATARLEKTAPAAVAVEPSPAPAQVPNTASASSAEAPVASAPKAAADYAAVTTTAPARRAARPQLGRVASRAAKTRNNQVVVADKEVLADAAEPAAAAAPDGWASSQPAAKPVAAASGAAVESADKSESVQLAEKVATADTVRTRNESSAASSAKKAKAFSAAPAPSSGATARVLATPLPGAIAIKPAPVGGTSALRDYLRREAMEFEPENNALRLTGTVRLKFIVGADGKVSDLKVTRGLREDYDNEAIRMVCEGPAWQPGVAGGRRAPLPMELNVTF
jgi:outer membrane biosynthesis protein TonB